MPAAIILTIMVVAVVISMYVPYRRIMQKYEQGNYMAYYDLKKLSGRYPWYKGYQKMLKESGKLWLKHYYDIWCNQLLMRDLNPDAPLYCPDVDFKSDFQFCVDDVVNRTEAETAGIDFYETIYEFAVQAYKDKEYTKAAITFAVLGDYEDSTDYLKKEEMLFRAEQVGNIIKFGRYDWYVTSRTVDTLTLLCKDVVGTKPYHEELTDVTWENCTLRAWLNDSFYNEFSEDEKTQIVKTACSNASQFLEDKGINAGNDTEDYIYLVNKTDLCWLLDPNLKNAILNCHQDWWLRTHGEEEQTASFINIDYIDTEETPYWQAPVTNVYGIRPAMTIKFN